MVSADEIVNRLKSMANSERGGSEKIEEDALAEPAEIAEEMLDRVK